MKKNENVSKENFKKWVQTAFIKIFKGLKNASLSFLSLFFRFSYQKLLIWGLSFKNYIFYSFAKNCGLVTYQLLVSPVELWDFVGAGHLAVAHSLVEIGEQLPQVVVVRLLEKV